MSNDATSIARGAWRCHAARDRAGWLAYLAETCTYREFATGREAQGAEAVTDVIFGWFEVMSDLHGEIERLTVADGQAVIETHWTGTHDGPMPMPDGSVIAPTGVETGPNPGCVIYRIEDDKIAEIRHYFDMAGPMAKITAAAG